MCVSSLSARFVEHVIQLVEVKQARNIAAVVAQKSQLASQRVKLLGNDRKQILICLHLVNARNEGLVIEANPNQLISFGISNVLFCLVICVRSYHSVFLLIP
jgi:hypothetical protein